MIVVKITQAISMIAKYLKARLVPMVTSSPGIGKSDAIRQVAKMYNLKVIDFRLAQCDPTDMNGFPYIDPVTGKATYIAMDTFPLEGDPIPEGYSGWLLFFDELTSASKAVQAAAYKIILDRGVGQKKMHKNVAMACAGNKLTDGAIVEEMSTALMSRLVHIHLEVDAEQWTDWATPNGIDHRITSYINFKPGNLYTFNPNHSDETYACPRTWEFADRIMKQNELGDPDLMPMLAGTLSEGVARELISFCNIHESLTKISEIQANPHGAKVSDEPGVLYAMTGSIAHHTNENNIDQLILYVRRLAVDFQVVCLRDILKRDPAMHKTKAIQDWKKDYSSVLF